jgi:hypothetical protein
MAHQWRENGESNQPAAKWRNMQRNVEASVENISERWRRINNGGINLAKRQYNEMSKKMAHGENKYGENGEMYNGGVMWRRNQ